MPSLTRFVLCCVAATWTTFAAGQLAAANNQTLPVSMYMTRPQAQAPALNISVQDGFSQGYIFISPYIHPGAGPYIYDKFGNLVWDGFGIAGPANAHDFKVCEYNGSDHLCLSQVNQQTGYAVGQAVILDSDYKIVATIQTGNDAMPADMHEFQLVNRGNGAYSGIVTAYQVIPYDMTYWNINGQGWLLEVMFQEIDVATGAILFEWYSTNHVDPTESVLKINSTTTDGGGNGLSPQTAYDYFHLNSIDKTPSGNYLISARHTATIYYINGTDRTVVWQLSYLGQSDFACTNFNFSFQHDARLISENDTITQISFFDNANDCTNSTDLVSSGRYITLDHTTGMATETRRVLSPLNISSCSQGNTQTLPNGHVFNGWGDKAYFSEHDANNNLVLLGTFTAGSTTVATAMNYRAFSFEWQSTPSTTKPAVYSYALDPTAHMQIHVSWNGATTVTTWRFYGSDVIGATFKVIGNVTKNGFETVWQAPGYWGWIMAEALAWDGTSLGNSSYQPTFVPGEALAMFCDNSSCPAVTAYGT